jgi:enterochelin esterase-like enzyme
VVDDLVPWIDEHLPVAKGPTSRIVGGSSLGGLVSLYVAWLHPEVFGGVAAFSPSVMWAGGRLTGALRAKLPGSHRIWLDAGTHERFDAGSFSLDYGGAVRHFAEHLRGLGYGPEELRVALDPRGTHDEASWGRRFPEAMRWLAREPG